MAIGDRVPSDGVTFRPPANDLPSPQAEIIAIFDNGACRDLNTGALDTQSQADSF